jgi:hypothetical protein
MDSDQTESNELGQPLWGMVIHDRVLIGDVTYKEAVEAQRLAYRQYGNECVIVTSDAARRMMRLDVL